MVVREQLSIVRAAPEDEAFLTRLGRAAFAEYSPNAAREIASMARRATGFVAFLGAERVGFILLEGPSDGTVHVSAIAVAVDARGRGVGRRLLERAEEAARAVQAKELGLVTADGNLAALELFLRMGFHRTRRSTRYYSRGQGGIWLTKSLA